MRYNPWQDALERYPDVHIEWHPILPAHAFWSPEDSVIVVDESISRAARRCALAHELAHMDMDDRPTSVCWFAARQESVADKLAARRLVDTHHLAEVMRWCLDPREIAAELEVTLDVLAIRCRWMAPWERGVVNRVLSRRFAVA